MPCSVAADSDCEAFVLAGGRSSRMGQDKAQIVLKGVALIEHALAILGVAGFSPRIAGARANLSCIAPTVQDDPVWPGLGPLSGICPALEATSAPLAVFLPVDLPLLPPSVISYLVHHALATGSAITVASICGFVETFPVVIHAAAAATLHASLRSGNRRCLQAFEDAAAALSRPFTVLPVELLLQAGQVDDPRGLPPRAWFTSINTPADLSAIEGLLQTERL